MKKCSYCGLENPDEATQCMTCLTDLVAPSASGQSGAKTESGMSPEEQRFWQRMTFRQFTILFLRLQAVWLLFNAAVELTYLPLYFPRNYGVSSYSARYSGLPLSFFLMLLRIILHVAAALAVVQYSERIVSWFARDWIPTQPSPNHNSIQPTNVAPKDSTQ
jgi:hypothetical protein